jgi:hypothetical protein
MYLPEPSPSLPRLLQLLLVLPLALLPLWFLFSSSLPFFSQIVRFPSFTALAPRELSAASAAFETCLLRHTSKWVHSCSEAATFDFSI